MNRRNVLGMTATTAIGLALSRARVFAQASAPGAEMSALSAYMSAAGTRALPAEAAEHAKHHLLDTLAAMISGSELPPGQAALRYIRAHAGKGAATIAGSALTAAPIDAALANGIMAHADETDDSHNASRSHPGCAVVPAALAAGEEFGIDGARFLRAVTLGYDVGTRVVMAMGGFDFSDESSLATPQHRRDLRRGGRGSVCRRSRRAPDALGARLCRTAILGHRRLAARHRPHREGLRVRRHAGAERRHLGAAGAIGLERRRRHLHRRRQFLPGLRARRRLRARLVEKLGERYEIARTNIKKWTVGSPIQGPLDAIEAMRSRKPFEADQVERVTVRLAPPVAEVVDNRDIPDICLQHMVAVMLLDKTVSFHAAHDKPRMQDAPTLRQRAKVNLVRDEELAKLLPVRVAVVEIELSDGSRLSERVSAVRGTPRNPMTRAEVIEKARDLTAPVLGRETSARLIEAVFAIEAVGDVRALRPLLRRG